MAINTPFLANNGNPNTVYNTTASPFAAPITLPDGSFPPITTPSWGGGPADPISYVGTMPAPSQAWAATAPQRTPVPWAPPSPPVSTQTLPWQPVAALGGATLGDYWTHQQATGGVPASGYADPASQYWRNMTQMAPATFNLSNSGALWGQGGGGQPAPAPAPEPSPEPTGPWQTPDPTTPVLNGGGQQVSTGGTTGMPGGELGPMPTNPFGPITHINMPGSTPIKQGNPLSNAIDNGFGLDSPNAPDVGANDFNDPKVITWLKNTVGEVASRLGLNSTQDVIGQAVDAFLPGNVYQPGEGWNWGNAITGILNAAFPGVGIVAGKLGEMLSNSEWGQTSDSWVARKLREWTEQNDAASLQQYYNNSGITWDTRQATAGGTNPWLGGMTGSTPKTNVNANIAVDQSNLSGAGLTAEQLEAIYAAEEARLAGANTAVADNPFGGGRTAGSSTIAQGAAAQRWLEEQRLAAMMGARPVAGQRVEDVFGMAER